MTVTSSNRDAIAHGKITFEPLRERPKFPSWALKLIMAVTGVIFGLFVIVHMLGNLKVFAGAGDFNAYAAFLRSVGAPAVPEEGVLWIFRIVLLVAVVLHVYGAFALHGRARQSRGKFRRQGMVSSWNTFTARTMIITGIVLLAFIIFHILDLTIGAAVAPADFVHGEAYANLVASFSRPAVAIWYIIAQLALLLHLSHGLWTATSDLGITGARWRKVLLFLSGLIPLLVVVGNIAIPVAVLTGVVS
ncbi:succinate dehydrogenase cytochrome b subunit [Corynebacterium freneyi]|uniref:Succinate dehydrogenase / fumarate reductase cytochrome b subunit n=1 Tax=Corynebacterium freneyi TaxID=134034 RepID=A0ABS4UB07_9CORY|nr:succinate dehydrogenase cytochrome b subunit [Corynebacterium freneyi]MBP2333678.1 succinate dehydrogenase / fumarate reductase cytochrome b subunit [Corynebacterium freneyi]MCG7439132.1 succinate dehydrogenase cytochrome b subunit [Corynebacterium freneyi]QXA52313.1 succinate dehydrogenase cytochrome b subunit [Corynebacterium freneyi]UBI02592.1 succinate dehydrogenase cytochrome b subunit [Corynebacterium freneyi]WJZ04219.1 Succinate dehydrogenase cytochrome b558 subunit [Corynebacterium 